MKNAVSMSILCATITCVGCTSGPFDHMESPDKEQCELILEQCSPGRSPFFRNYVENLIQQYNCAAKKGCEPRRVK